MSIFDAVPVVIALGTPALFAPMLVSARGRLPAFLSKLCETLICLTPLTAPWGLSRTFASSLSIWLVAIAAAIVTLKAIDWVARPRYRNNLARVWLALTIWPALDIEDVLIPGPSVPSKIRLASWRILTGIVAVTSGLALAAVGRTLGLPENHFWLDNILKTFEIYLLAGGSNNLLVAAFALAGYKLTDGFRYPVLAHSVLDFWSRYNVWIHRWLKRHVFEPIGRRGRKPVLGILAVFLFSGMAHEYLFLPFTYELAGWQLAFFGVHGLGSLAAIALGRAFRRVFGISMPWILAVAATLAFVLATAPIFIHCLDRVFDLHRDVGGWVLTTIGS